MHGTTRELNIATISFVSVIFVLLLISIVAASTAWFRYEFEAQRQERITHYGTNPELLDTQTKQQTHLTGKGTGINITDAISQVAEKY